MLKDMAVVHTGKDLSGWLGSVDPYPRCAVGVLGKDR